MIGIARVLQLLIFLYIICLHTVCNKKDIGIQNLLCESVENENGHEKCRCASEKKPIFVNIYRISPDVRKLSISNCKSIRFNTNPTHKSHGLQHINLDNISSIIFEKHSLAVSYNQNAKPLNITIKDSNIKDIWPSAITGRINNVLFQNVTIGTLHNFSISNLEETSQITLDYVTVKHISTRSFHNISTNILDIKNSMFDMIPTKSFYGISAKVFTMSNVTINHLEHLAFQILHTEVCNWSNLRIHEGDRTNIVFYNSSINSIDKCSNSNKGNADTNGWTTEGAQTIDPSKNISIEDEKGKNALDTSILLVIIIPLVTIIVIGGVLLVVIVSRRNFSPRNETDNSHSDATFYRQLNTSDLDIDIRS